MPSDLVRSLLTKQLQNPTLERALTSLTMKMTVSIIDVCCPFDNGADALDEAEMRKITKHEHLKQWHPSNEKVLQLLGMTKSYKGLFRKLCCTDATQGSPDVYRRHLGCAE